jgi:hypothetical protein
MYSRLTEGACKIDLLTSLYDFIFGDLKSNASDLIATNCIRSLIDDSYTYKRGTSDADYPELALSLVGITGPTTSSSSHSKFSVNYEVLISSGSLTQVKINKLCWFLMTRMTYLSKNTGIFVWKDDTPLKKISFLNGQIGLTRAEANRNVVGFSSMCTIVAEVQVLTSLFLPLPGSNV